MQAVPLLKPVSAKGRIAPEVYGVKSSDSKKRIRLQDREDVAMEGEDCAQGSSPSQDCEGQDEASANEKQELPVVTDQ